MLDDIAEGYVRVALQLAQHDPELIDRWRGPDGWRPGPRQPVAPLVARVEALMSDMGRLPVDGANADRTRYLALQLGALQLAGQRLLGTSGRFDDEARQGFGVVRTPLDEGRLDAARQAIARELPGGESLEIRYAAYKRRLAVGPDRMESVMRAALSACREATIRRIQLPADEQTDLVFVSGSPWDGYARYLGGHRTRIEVNRDAAFDVTRALRLACHEAYPGHHVQYMWLDDELVVRRGWKEFALFPAFGRHLLVSEGAAEAGVDLAFPPDKRVQLYRDVLLPLAGLPTVEAERLVRIETEVAELEPVIADVIASYLDSGITNTRALERLTTEALVSSAQSLLAFAERRRTRVLAYPEGHAAVDRAIRGGSLRELRRLFTDRPFMLDTIAP